MALVFALSISCGGSGPVDPTPPPPPPVVPPPPPPPPPPSPSISGQVIGLFDGPEWVGNPRITINYGGVSRSTSVSPDGSFSFFDVPADSVDLIIDESDASNRKFFPVIIALTKPNFLNAKIIRIPVKWAAESGVYGGEEVDISLHMAYSLDVSGNMGTSFFQRGYSLQNQSWSYSHFFFGWDPIPIAFDRDGSNSAILAIDSTVFWSSVDSVEKFWGRDLFYPSDFSNLQLGIGVRVSIDTSFQGAGAAGFNFSPSGEIVGGSVILKDEDLLPSFVVVSHELQHVLGFGHTCSWATLMFNFCPFELKIPYPTLHDVAYGTLFHAVGRRSFERNARYGLPEAHQGERVLMLGLPREIIRYQ